MDFVSFFLLRKLGMKSTSLYIKILFITFLTTFFGIGDGLGRGDRRCEIGDMGLLSNASK